MREIEAIYPEPASRLKYSTDLCTATYSAWNTAASITTNPVMYYLRDVMENNQVVNVEPGLYTSTPGSFMSNASDATYRSSALAFILDFDAICEDVVTTYNGKDQSIASQNPKPVWYSSEMQFTYTKGGKAVTTVKDVGEYNVHIIAGGFSHDYKITVTPREIAYLGELTVSDKAYDGTTKATVPTQDISFDNLIDGDKVALDVRANFITKDIGTGKPVSADVTLKGEDAGNYTLTNGGKKELNGNINVCTVVVNGIKVSNKEYDKTDAATLDLTGVYLSSLTGNMRNDDVTVAATGKFRQVMVGQNIIVDLTVDLAGADAHNYVIGGNTQVLAFGNINPRAITVKIDKVRSPINADLSALTATVQSGSLASGDTLNDIVALTTDADYAILGEYQITGKSINDNYAVTFANDGAGVYEIYDPALEPDPEPGTVDNPNGNFNLWLVIFCAGGVTAIVLILIILIAIIKHQHRLAREKARQSQIAPPDKK